MLTNLRTSIYKSGATNYFKEAKYSNMVCFPHEMVIEIYIIDLKEKFQSKHEDQYTFTIYFWRQNKGLISESI